MLNDLTATQLREMNQELKDDMMIVLSENSTSEEAQRITLKWKQQKFELQEVET